MEKRKMMVQRKVNKISHWFFFVILVVFSIVALYFGTIHRFTYASNYENYSDVAGRINSLQSYEHEDSDDGTYYTYSAEIEYTVDGTEYIRSTGDIFSEGNVPKEGQKISILYNNDNPNDYVVAKEDWMTRSLIPVTDDGDLWLFFSVFALAFALIAFAMNLDIEKTKGIVLGCGLMLMGIDGVVMGAIMDNVTLYFLVIFGAVGAFILYRHLFVSAEQCRREGDANASLRMIKVVDIYIAPQTGLKTVVFSMAESDGNAPLLLSYDDHNHRFHSGDIYQISKDEVMECHEERLVNGFDTIDISGIDEKAIRPVGAGGF
ncbi:MAG: DUF3592 domain-containing protein [Roseburia sp.]